MKCLLAIFAVAVCVGFKNVQSVPTPVKLAYPWANWLAVRPLPPGLALLAQAQAQSLLPQLATPAAPAPAPEDESPEALANYLIARSILPAAPSKKGSKTEVTDETTTKKPKLIEVGDFWAPPTIGPNITDPAVIDPAFWAAKKTMFISKLFAALAKQVLNSTGTVTTTTESPNTALLKEIDTVLLSDVARSVLGDGPPGFAGGAAAAKKAEKTAKKDAAKSKKKATKVKGPPPFVLAKAKAAAPTTAAPESDEEESSSTPHPTLDYSSLAKALLS